MFFFKEKLCQAQAEFGYFYSAGLNLILKFPLSLKYFYKLKHLFSKLAQPILNINLEPNSNSSWECLHNALEHHIATMYFTETLPSFGVDRQAYNNPSRRNIKVNNKFVLLLSL